MRPAGLALLLIAFATPARAQLRQSAPLPLVIAEVRTGPVKLGTDPTTATDVGLATTRQPAAGWAGLVAVHAYPIRAARLAIGVGAETWFARSFALTTEPAEDLHGPAILTRRIAGWSGVASVNFGTHDTWGYLSAGAGPLRFQTISSELPHTNPRALVTPEIGGGIRWFRTSHLGAVLDARAYLTPAQAATPTTIGRGRKSVVLISVGVSIR